MRWALDVDTERNKLLFTSVAVEVQCSEYMLFKHRKNGADPQQVASVSLELQWIQFCSGPPSQCFENVDVGECGVGTERVQWPSPRSAETSNESCRRQSDR